MSIQTAWQATFDFWSKLPIVVEPSSAQLSSDGGLLPLRQFDEQIGLTRQFAQALDDPRLPGLTGHSFQEMVRSRVFGVLAAYEDQNDHDTLRHDPIFKLIAERSPEDDPLASQPTLSRFENAINIRSLKRLRDLFIDQFIASFATPPKRLTFDIDAVDDPAHGDQQLVLFHGYFDQYQYFPSFITCADNDQTVVLSLRPGAVHAALGADDDLAHLVARLRQVWPGVHLHARGDAGYGMPWMYQVCERLSVDYTFGIAANNVLKKRSEALLEQAQAQFAATGQPQRLFDAFWYRAGTWPTARWVIVKVEANAQGTNRRFIVTNRSGARIVPEAAYDDYAARGEAENRNKELKCDLCIDRTSDHRFLANFFRLYLHAAAHNLLVRLRRAFASPPPPPPIIRSLDPPESDPVPIEARSGRDRRYYFNRRRQKDPLGEGQPCTWRSLLIKVAAEVVVSSRRILVRLSASWPYLDWYHRLCIFLGSAPPVSSG
ncbi:MAG TPA: IS1380 family transposase [Candidatus Acidoferrales bacterium]|nr:IS1380 family transposase [Candidatus Acidoferrales bacterium]